MRQNQKYANGEKGMGMRKRKRKRRVQGRYEVRKNPM